MIKLSTAYLCGLNGALATENLCRYTSCHMLTARRGALRREGQFGSV